MSYFLYPLLLVLWKIIKLGLLIFWYRPKRLIKTTLRYTLSRIHILQTEESKPWEQKTNDRYGTANVCKYLQIGDMVFRKGTGRISHVHENSEVGQVITLAYSASLVSLSNSTAFLRPVSSITSMRLFYRYTLLYVL